MYDNLFKPIKIGNVTVPNRIAHEPTDMSSATSEGEVSERVLAYHEEIARGGCGLIIAGASSPDRVTGRPSITALAVDEDYFIPGLHRLAEVIHRNGAKCAVQIQHPGRQAVYPRDKQISCSDMISYIPGSSGHEVIYATGEAKGKIARAMEVEEIYDLIEKFAEGAWRVQQAGFDAVELHGAHGYMIAQFLSPYTNKRNDRFGGTLQNRLRFVLEIIDRIHRKCGDDFPVMVRYSAEEWMPGSRMLGEAVEIAKALENAGVAALDISAGIFDAPGPTMDPVYYKEGWNTYSADAIKKNVSVPVITSHSLRNPEYCDKIIGEGLVDMVGMSRQLIADPYWANKAKAGKVKEIRRCISCLVGCWKESLMVKQEMRCAINPAVGDERFLHMAPAEKKLNVAIAGGGAAGMEAARIAALRGHKCTIFEKENELGGILRACCMVPPKDRMKWHMDWLRDQIANLGVEVRLNTEASLEGLKGYDVVLCGTGAKTAMPDIPGAGDAIKFEDVMVCSKKNCEYWPEGGKPAPRSVGQNIVIWGNHYAAIDTAEALAMRGKAITIVTEDREFAPEIEPIHKEILKMRFEGGNGQALDGTPIKIPVRIFTQATLIEYTDGNVTVMDNNFKKTSIPCDDLILAKQEPNDALYQSLLATGVMVANIGDSREVRNLRGAVTDGAQVGLMLDDGLFMNANNVLCSQLPYDVAQLMK